MLQFSDYTISEKKLRKSIAEGGQDHLEIFSKLAERKFRIGDLGIARNNLHHCVKTG